MELIDQYKACAKSSMTLFQHKTENGTPNELSSIKIANRYAHGLKERESELWQIDGMSFYLRMITRSIFKVIDNAQQNKDNSVKWDHSKIVDQISMLKSVTNAIRHVGETDVLKSIELSNFYTNTLKTFYLILDQFGIKLEKSPLDSYFDEIRKELNEIASLKQIKKAKALEKLKKELPQQSINVPITNLQWQGSQTDLAEVLKALFVNGNIKGTQKEFFEVMSKVLNFKIDETESLRSLKRRNAGSEVRLLYDLQNSLIQYYAK